MNQLRLFPSTLQGILQLPASKSITHRALICAALARGTSVLYPIVQNEDIISTLTCLQTLGARIQYDEESDECTVEGFDPKTIPSVSLDCHYSGSTLRFLIPVAALSDQPVTFTGNESLLSRPMGVYANLFEEQNLRFDQSATSIVIQGPLQPGLFSIPGDVSSQFISGLLFATPLMNSTSEIAILGDYQSRSYVLLTLQMLKRFGIDIVRLTREGYSIAGNQIYQPQKLQIEADYSQLSYFGVYAALKNGLGFENLNPDSVQGDRVILAILRKAGARVSWKGNVLQISPAKKYSISVDLKDCPDLAPALFVLASFLPGRSSFLNISRLRYKESDRIESMKEELSKFGVKMDIQGELLFIQGKEHFETEKPVLINTHNDHRIAMAMSIFALCNDSEVIIDNPEVVNKSYPDFFEDLKKLGAKIQ